MTPLNPYNGMSDSNVTELIEYLMKKFNEKQIAYVQMSEAPLALKNKVIEGTLGSLFKKKFKGFWIAN